MEFEESIFNLIPKEAYVPPKPKQHKSKHDPLLEPTMTTFKGKKAAMSTFGLAKGSAKPDVNQFRLKGTGTFQLPERKLHSYSLTQLFRTRQIH